MNVIARLEYELAYYDSAVRRFNHYTTRTPPVLVVVGVIFCYDDVYLAMQTSAIYTNLGEKLGKIISNFDSQRNNWIKKT